jgi:hypothetical protein
MNILKFSFEAVRVAVGIPTIIFLVLATGIIVKLDKPKKERKDEIQMFQMQKDPPGCCNYFF